MGINLTWVCTVHNRAHTSLRGHEGDDFQKMVRGGSGCPADCLRNGNMRVYHDGYFVRDADTKEIFVGGIGYGWRNDPELSLR